MDLAWFAAVLGFWAMEISIHSTQTALQWWRAVAWVFFGCFAVGFALTLSVIFFNWPRFIVPPPQRGECGALAEWRRRGSGRQGAKP
jgi:hypothetical protein